jgi:hypothetical protein
LDYFSLLSFMNFWLIFGVVVLASGVGIVLLCRARTDSFAKNLEAKLTAEKTSHTVGFSSLSTLPSPVTRYFRRVLTDGQELIQFVEMIQRGELRTGVDSGKWLPFSARQQITPPSRTFQWQARISLPLGAHIQVTDSYIDGRGAGQVRLCSLVPLGREKPTPQLNSGALHRFLAEAVWCPTALLPQAGVEWQTIDDHSALATLNDRGTSVSLVFRFNERDEVCGIYTPGRIGKFKDGFHRVPWEGRFSDYRLCGGVRVPFYGEVGWHVGDRLQLVWKGWLENVRYS